MLHDVAAEEGLVAIAYERAHGSASRVHWAAKAYLFAGSSGLYNCPLAMTDGAARVAELSEAPWHSDGLGHRVRMYYRHGGFMAGEPPDPAVPGPSTARGVLKAH